MFLGLRLVGLRLLCFVFLGFVLYYLVLFCFIWYYFVLFCFIRCYLGFVGGVLGFLLDIIRVRLVSHVCYLIHLLRSLHSLVYMKHSQKLILDLNFHEKSLTTLAPGYHSLGMYGAR